jgi:hypothetical protein
LSSGGVCYRCELSGITGELEGKGLRVMSDIEKIIEGLELIEIVVPSYKHARRKGITDEEAEKLVNQAIEQAINILEQRTIDEHSKD